jgi:type IV pilus assembly protein PilV
MRMRQSGATMMEVLVAIIITIVGLLGLAGLQARINVSEMESFQRAQALVLLQDMVDRINANRKNAATYITATPVGTGVGIDDCAGKFDAALDLCQWNNSLLGAAESAGGLKVGAMIGARGCVQQLSATPPQQYLVSVVWQGLNATVAPATTCGSGQYGSETTRRAVVASIMIGCLQNNPVTGACITTPAPAPIR